MHGKRHEILGIALAGATALLLSYGGLVGTATRVEAGPCFDLWYYRNVILARKGHCFDRCGRRVWGYNHCFPPYGKLTPWEAREVREYDERARGFRCPPCPRASE